MARNPSDGYPRVALHEERAGVVVRVERAEVVDSLSHADELHGNAELMGDRDGDAALRRSVQLRQRDAGHARGLREEPCLLEPVLPRRRVDDEQRLVRSALEPAGDHASYLGELVHEIPLRVQAAGGVDDDDVSLTRTARLHGVVRDGGGIRAARAADELRARPLRPDLELLLGRRAEGVGRADEHRAAVLRQLASELSDRRRLPRAVDADDEDDGRALGGVPEYRRVAEERLDLLGERLTEITQLAAGLEAPHELPRRGNSDVGADQRHLEPLPGVLLCGVERGSELRDECPPALAQRVAKPREEAAPLLGLPRP